MKWNTNTEKITKKAAKRIFLLKVLKSYGGSSGDMKEFYITVIRPTLQGVSQKKRFCPLNVHWESFLTDQSPCVGINSVFFQRVSP